MVTQPILGRSTLQAMLPKMQANLARRVQHWVTLGTFEWYKNWRVRACACAVVRALRPRLAHPCRYTQIKEWAFDNASALVWGSDISQPSDERHRLFEIFENMNKGLGGCLPIKVCPFTPPMPLAIVVAACPPLTLLALSVRACVFAGV
jgi:hypothetical protein